MIRMLISISRLGRGRLAPGLGLMDEANSIPVTVHGSNGTKYGRLESPHGERLPLKRRIDEVL